MKPIYVGLFFLAFASAYKPTNPPVTAKTKAPTKFHLQMVRDDPFNITWRLTEKQNRSLSNYGFWVDY